MLSCASTRAVELGPLRGPLVLGPPTNPLSPSFALVLGVQLATSGDHELAIDMHPVPPDRS